MSQFDENEPVEEVQSAGSSEIGSSQGLTIKVPAAVGNFGPGFETFGLAVNLYLRVSVKVQAPRKKQGIEIVLRGSIAEQVPSDSTNLIAKVIEHAWPQDPRLLSCLSVTIESGIPVSVGLGSSATATISGVTAALALSGIPLEKGRIFDLVLKVEGHAESACASVFGGFTLCAPNIIPGDYLPRKLVWPDKWKLIAVMPQYKVSSKKARAALPASVSYKDAIMNVQRAALLVEAVAAGDDEGMRAALRDRLHEPYKGKLVPELADLRKYLQESDALGTVLSGSGPTMLTIVNERYKTGVIQQLESWVEGQKTPCQLMELQVDTDGLIVDS